MTKTAKTLFFIGLLVFGFGVFDNLLFLEDKTLISQLVFDKGLIDSDQLKYIKNNILIEAAGFIINLLFLAFYIYFAKRFINSKKMNAVFYSVTAVLIFIYLMANILPALVRYLIFAYLNLLDSWFIVIFYAALQKCFHQMMGLIIMLIAAVAFRKKETEAEEITLKTKAVAAAFVGVAAFSIGFTARLVSSLLYGIKPILNPEKGAGLKYPFTIFIVLALAVGFTALFVPTIIKNLRGKQNFCMLTMLMAVAAVVNIIFASVIISSLFVEMPLIGDFYTDLYYICNFGAVYSLYGALVIFFAARMLRRYSNCQHCGEKLE